MSHYVVNMVQFQTCQVSSEARVGSFKHSILFGCICIALSLQFEKSGHRSRSRMSETVVRKKRPEMTWQRNVERNQTQKGSHPALFGLDNTKGGRRQTQIMSELICFYIQGKLKTEDASPPTMGTLSNPDSFSLSFTLRVMSLRYGRANTLNSTGPRQPAWDSNTCRAWRTNTHRSSFLHRCKNILAAMFEKARSKKTKQ